MTYTTDLKIRQEVSDNCSKLNEWRTEKVNYGL